MKPRTSPFLKSCIQHTLRWSFTLVVLIALAYVTFVSIRFHHLDTKVYAWFSSGAAPTANAATGKGRALDTYRMELKTVQIAGITRNLSGLAFDPDQHQLIAVVNRPATLLLLSLNGELKSKHRLHHASDVEGVAYLGNGRVAMVEEGKSRIVFTQIPQQANVDIDLKEASFLQLSLGEPEKNGVLAGNHGFEGIGYDMQRDYLYVAKEHSPRALYRISGIAQPQRPASSSVSIENLSHWVQSDAVVGTDLSSVEVDPTNGHLLLLSDESQSLVELDTQGRFLGRVQLSSWWDRDESIPQAEGIAIDAAGTIYIVSEPNFFYRLTPAPQP